MFTGDERPVIAITGANRGIGYHLLRALLDDGYRVAAFDKERDHLDALTAPGPEGLGVYECDVTDAGAVETTVSALLDAWGRIDVFVNNAAIAPFGAFESQAGGDIQAAMDVNCLGYVNCIHAVLPHMRARDEGIIHNVGSPTGDLGHPGLSGYAASKGAIKSLTRSLRQELDGTGVTCTLVLPPTTDTRLTAALGYPPWLVADAADVGRKLAKRIESTDAVITPDWQTAVGIRLLTRVPQLWHALTRRYVDLPT